MVFVSRSAGLAASAAAFALGIAVSIHWNPGTFALSGGVVAGLALAAAWPAASPVAFAAAGIAAGSASRAPPGAARAGAALEGPVVSMPRRQDDRVRFVVADPDAGRVDVSAPDLPAPLAPGDRVRIAADLRPLPGPRNPGGRDAALSQELHGISASGWSRLPPARVAPPSALSGVAAARDGFAGAAARALPPREAALVRAIGAGDDSAVDAETRDRFSRSGLAHVLSVSGLHLAVVALGAWRILRAGLARVGPLSRRWDARRPAAALALPVTALYAVATGASVPVVRSAIATGLLFGGVVIGRRPDARAALALAAIGILAVDPGSLTDVSFQLSFASVAGLLALAGPLQRALPVRPDLARWRGRVLAAVLSGACASAAATLATAPLLALHFRRLSTLAIPANMVGLPFASALTVLAAIAFLSSAAAPAAAPLLLLACRPFATAFLRVNDAFAWPPVAVVAVASPGWALVAASYTLGAGALLARGRRRLVLAVAAAAAIAVPGPARHAAARARGDLEIVFLSVGQGDCTILRLPDGSAVVVDAGGDPAGRRDPGARDVLPFLLDMGVRRISAVFVSHPHPDHLQGLPAVVAGLPVDHVFASHDRGDAAARAAFARMPEATTLAAGDEVVLSGVRFRVLGPPAGDRRLVENDASLVLHVTWGETSLLLPGDVEAAGESALAAGGIPRVDVVKAPHHGSRTSSGRGLVSATAPRWVVFPVGAGNRYGFPHAETVARWRETGAELLRTDGGPVRFLSDGRRIRRVDPAGALDAWSLARGS